MSKEKIHSEYIYVLSSFLSIEANYLPGYLIQHINKWDHKFNSNNNNNNNNSGYNINKCKNKYSDKGSGGGGDKCSDDNNNNNKMVIFEFQLSFVIQQLERIMSNNSNVKISQCILNILNTVLTT